VVGGGGVGKKNAFSRKRKGKKMGIHKNYNRFGMRAKGAARILSSEEREKKKKLRILGSRACGW